MPCPSHPPWLDHSNYICRRVQVMKLLIMQFSPARRKECKPETFTRLTFSCFANCGRS
jgi:hypothetical protein